MKKIFKFLLISSIVTNIFAADVSKIDDSTKKYRTNMNFMIKKDLPRCPELKNIGNTRYGNTKYKLTKDKSSLEEVVKTENLELNACKESNGDIRTQVLIYTEDLSNTKLQLK